MDLSIDIGNNYFNLAVFEFGNLLYENSNKNSFIFDEIDSTIKSYKKIDWAIISNVSDLDLNDFFFKKEIKMISVSNSLKLPFKINYKPLKSLGADRISLAAAAFISYPNLNNIIIDIGTCITVDVFEKKNIFSGGSISPGIEMRYKSLNSFTSKLPLLKKSNQKKYPANTTEDCIHNGVIGGVVSEILTQIEIYKKKYQSVNVIVTGGDANFLFEPLNFAIFVDRKFILKGLNFILNQNKKS